MLLHRVRWRFTSTSTHTARMYSQKPVVCLCSKRYNTDTTMSNPIVSSSDMRAIRFANRPLSFMGKTNVSKITKPSTFFYGYDLSQLQSNNDVNFCVRTGHCQRQIGFTHTARTHFLHCVLRVHLIYSGIMASAKVKSVADYLQQRNNYDRRGSSLVRS